MPKLRMSRRVLVVLVVDPAVLLGSCGALANDAWDTHQAKVRQQRIDRALNVYGTTMTPLVGQLWSTLRPIDTTLAVLDDPRPGDVIAVRDAIRSSLARKRLAALIGQLKGVDPPPRVAQDHQRLRDLADGMASDLDRLAAVRPDAAYETLFDVLSGPRRDSFRESFGLVPVRVKDVFRPTKVQAPALPTVGVPPTKEAWVVAADRACIRTSLALFSLKKPSGLAQAQRFARAYGTEIATLNTSIRRLPVAPADKARLTRTVLGPMKVSERLSAAYLALSRSTGSAFSFQANRADELSRQLGPFARGLKAYGAEHCQLVLLGAPGKAGKPGSSDGLTA